MVARHGSVRGSGNGPLAWKQPVPGNPGAAVERDGRTGSGDLAEESEVAGRER